MNDRDGAAMARLEDQISWYDRRSAANQRWYKTLKVAVLIITGLVPVSAAFGFPAAIAGLLGFFALVAEGLQQLNQFHANWISYRSTCESLKHEKHLFLAGAAHYRDVVDPIGLLAEQVESLVSVEHAKWVATNRDAEKKSQTDR
jgi:hypothetical protein